MKLTRKEVISRVPFSFGIIQRVADDLRVTRAAVSQFIHKPENCDILEMLEQEKSRIYDYAQLNIFDAIICNDKETTKWYLATFPQNGTAPQKKYTQSKKKDDEYILSTSEWGYSSIRKMFHKGLDREDAYLEGANTNALPESEVKQLKANPPQPLPYRTYEKEKLTDKEEMNFRKRGSEKSYKRISDKSTG
ncbi:MAG: hypothetical protein JST55_08520 [Bacteroidetes bacterium]|nr:hypothetical protein [Bacteroidota bacterium]